MGENPIRKEVNGDEPARYSVPAGLVHKLIVAIFASLFALAGYMVIWAVNDAAYKTTQSNRLDALEREDRRFDVLTQGGILPIAKQRIEHLEARMTQAEADLREMRNRDNRK